MRSPRNRSCTPGRRRILGLGCWSRPCCAEHRDILGLLEAIGQATSPVRAAANAQALRSLFDSHLVKENEQILPLLAESSEVSLAEVLGDMHELLGGQDHGEYADAECGCEGECRCGHQHPSDLDAPWEVPAQ